MKDERDLIRRALERRRCSPATVRTDAVRETDRERSTLMGGFGGEAGEVSSLQRKKSTKDLKISMDYSSVMGPTCRS